MSSKPSNSKNRFASKLQNMAIWTAICSWIVIRNFGRIVMEDFKRSDMVKNSNIMLPIFETLAISSHLCRMKLVEEPDRCLATNLQVRIYSCNVYRTGFQWVCKSEMITSFSRDFYQALHLIASDSAKHQLAEARCSHQIPCVRRVRAEVGWLISNSKAVVGSPANCASTDAHSIFPG